MLPKVVLKPEVLEEYITTQVENARCIHAEDMCIECMDIFIENVYESQGVK